MGGDFGLPFSLFVAAWIGTEVLTIVGRESLEEAYDVVHLVVLVALALWMNVRWRWALRKAVQTRG